MLSVSDATSTGRSQHGLKVLAETKLGRIAMNTRATYFTVHHFTLYLFASSSATGHQTYCFETLSKYNQINENQ
jgi:hypothetical protein